MWEFIVIAVALSMIIHGLASSQQNSLGVNLTGGGDSSLYYSQHRRYPFGSWWIPFYDPSHHCHQKARVRCQPAYFYDNCYERTLNKCNQSLRCRLRPTDLLAWGHVSI